MGNLRPRGTQTATNLLTIESWVTNWHWYNYAKQPPKASHIFSLIGLSAKSHFWMHSPNRLRNVGP